MTDQPETAVDRIPLARSVHYVARGLPEVPNQYGPGVLAPSEITLTYRSAPDSQLGRVHAYVAGRIWVDGKELPLLPGGLYGQHYFDGMEGWPAWLAEEARLHDPAAAPAPVLPPADRAAHVFPLPARAALITYAATTRTVTADDLTPLLDAFDAECSASALRKAADEIDRTDLPDDHVDMFDNGARWATSQLRRMAAEARDNCPGYETVPNRCTCGCEGCKHHCGAHNPDDAQDAEPADRGAVYREVADRLAADAEQGAKDGLTRIYRRSAARQVREWADELGAEARGNDKQDDGVALPAPAAERPRCPHCGLPHDLDEAGGIPAVCASIRARLADAERRHAEGDHGGCAAVACDVVRARRSVEAEAADPETETNGRTPCRAFVSGGTVWCCEEGETDCPCICHQAAAEARRDGAQS